MRRIGSFRDGRLPGGRSGFLMRLISLRVAKSTTANPFKPLSCANIHFVEPSGFVLNVIGRTPRSMSSVHAVSSVLRVDHVDRLSPNRAGDDVLAVRGDVGVVDGALRRDRLDPLKSDACRSRRRRRASWMIPTYTRWPSRPTAMLLGWPLSGILLDDLQRLRVDDVERALRFVADVDAAAVGRDAGAVVHLDPLDHADHLVGGGIDDVDVVPGAVGLDDPDLAAARSARPCTARSRRHRETPTNRVSVRHRFNSYAARVDCDPRYFAGLSQHPGFQVCHSGSFCEAPVLAAVVIEIAAGLFLERVHQEPALQAAGQRDPLDRLEFLRDSSSVQVVAPGGERLQAHGVPCPWQAMHRAWPGRLAEEDRLDSRS